MFTKEVFLRRLIAVQQRLREESERGDVPGWVLITMMTAGLVTALWAIAGPLLNQVFTEAINGVSGP